MLLRRDVLKAAAAVLALPLVFLNQRRATADDGAPLVFAPPPPDNQPLERIAFGSCNDQRLSQGIWDVILGEDPQLLLLLGDNVYGDVTSADMTELRKAYAALAAEPGFRRLVAQVPTLATWDDHDYGANDAGADFPYRAQSQALFRSFWQVRADSPRSGRDGVYEAWRFGPDGQRVQVILLDTRFFRSPLKPTDQRNAPGRERYLPDPDPNKTMLGEAQWTWLEQQLRQEADLRLLVSSIQVLPEGHGFERWGNLPLERQRLIRLIGETQAQGVVLLSGDRHFGALYQLRTGVPYPLTEITSSSFNRPWRDANETDPLSLSPLYPEANFGMVHIHWGEHRVTLELRGADGSVVRSYDIDMTTLSASY